MKCVITDREGIVCGGDSIFNDGEVDSGPNSDGARGSVFDGIWGDDADKVEVVWIDCRVGVSFRNVGIDVDGLWQGGIVVFNLHTEIEVWVSVR